MTPQIHLHGCVQEHAVQQVQLPDLVMQTWIHAHLQTSFPVQYNLHKTIHHSAKYSQRYVRFMQADSQTDYPKTQCLFSLLLLAKT